MTPERPPRVYLDVCCLNRPFDDQRQERVRLESEAVLRLLDQVRQGQVIWVSSAVVAREVQRTPTTRRSALVRLLARAHESVRITEGIEERAAEIARLGLHNEDAAHLACAEAAAVDAFLTTDDRLLRMARRNDPSLWVRVMNPLVWVAEQGDQVGR